MDMENQALVLRKPRRYTQAQRRARSDRRGLAIVPSEASDSVTGFSAACKAEPPSRHGRPLIA
ncbi:MAG: hypothetical protein WA005_09415, partial [Candidatus Binataceae bacterium]